MILISHRGNIFGADPRYENSPEQIRRAYHSGYYCEVDIRLNTDGKLVLGHDLGTYDYEDIEDYIKERLYHHCKDVKTYMYFKEKLSNRVYFFHESDEITLVSNGMVWAHPNCEDVENKICLLLANIPSQARNIRKASGFCFDNVDYLINI